MSGKFPTQWVIPFESDVVYERFSKKYPLENQNREAPFLLKKKGTRTLYFIMHSRSCVSGTWSLIFLFDPVYFVSDVTYPVAFPDQFILADPVEIWMKFGLYSGDLIEYLGFGDLLPFFQMTDSDVWMGWKKLRIFKCYDVIMTLWRHYDITTSNEVMTSHVMTSYDVIMLYNVMTSYDAMTYHGVMTSS